MILVFILISSMNDLLTSSHLFALMQYGAAADDDDETNTIVQRVM